MHLVDLFERVWRFRAHEWWPLEVPFAVAPVEAPVSALARGDEQKEKHVTLKGARVELT